MKDNDEMNVRKDGLAYKIAYGFTKKEDRPNQVNICPFLWRVIY